jgi:hypothetical protein
VTATRRPCGCTTDPGVFGHNPREHEHAEWLAEVRPQIAEASQWPVSQQIAWLKSLARPSK